MSPRWVRLPGRNSKAMIDVSLINPGYCFRHVLIVFKKNLGENAGGVEGEACEDLRR